MNTISEIACSEAAVYFVNEYAMDRKLNQLQIAMTIPGIVHNHVATELPTDDCAYCKRNGNVFNAEQQQLQETDDIILRYRKRVETIFKEMEAEINKELDAKIIF
jgi:hypothetical protein